jgi:hypothetical protein
MSVQAIYFHSKYFPSIKIHSVGSIFKSLFKSCFSFLLIVIPLTQLDAQQKKIFFTFEESAGFITPGEIPFWLRANRFGSIPDDNLSLSLTGSFHREYVSKKNLDWGAGIETRINAGSQLNFRLIEGYGKVRFSFFEILAGRTKEITGLCDTSLSSGSFSISGNAPGIPKIQIAVNEFQSLPVLGKVLAFKGNFSHGWLGKATTSLNGTMSRQITYFHQKSFYGRFGKPGWKLKLYGGLNHQVFWGSEKEIFGNDYTLSPFKTYLYVISGKGYSTSEIEPSRIGNHLGSFDIGGSYEFRNFRLFIYRQNFYDFIAFRYLANISDGLNGISFESKKINNGQSFHLKKFLVEFLYSKDQGKRYSRHDPSFYNENYYNNYIYSNGWSYKGVGLGNSLLTPKTQMKQGLSDDRTDYFLNNRVAAIHLGTEGSMAKINFIIKATYSENFGTYFTSLTETHVHQFSAFLEGRRSIGNNLNIGLRLAIDRGNLLYNSSGLLLMFSQYF